MIEVERLGGQSLVGSDQRRTQNEWVVKGYVQIMWITFCARFLQFTCYLCEKKQYVQYKHDTQISGYDKWTCISTVLF